MKKFALIGAAGYVAPKHLQAIKETGGELIACLDPSDSVGILDSYFSDVHYFREFERFERFVYKVNKNKKTAIDYISIASPNYLHDSHIRFALRAGASAICEKPLVINPWNLDGLRDLEDETGQRVWSMLQLRHHPAIAKLKQKMSESRRSERSKIKISLMYITSRGNWYLQSWKGDESKSGGLAANIGIHFFDMLIYVFGDALNTEVHACTEKRISGKLIFETATVDWMLSIDSKDLPREAEISGKRSYRSILIDGEELEFSGGFDKLHTAAYRHILAGNGLGVEESRPAIELVSKIRRQAR